VTLISDEEIIRSASSVNLLRPGLDLLLGNRLSDFCDDDFVGVMVRFWLLSWSWSSGSEKRLTPELCFLATDLDTEGRKLTALVVVLARGIGDILVESNFEVTTRLRAGVDVEVIPWDAGLSGIPSSFPKSESDSRTSSSFSAGTV
jgi:hypothetical protein